MQSVPEIFQYEQPEFPEDCIYNISPSQLYKFYENPSEWYRTTARGEKSEFKGNTRSVLGTICHYVYEKYAKREKIDKQEIEDQLIGYSTAYPDLQLDVPVILKDYPQVVERVVNDYIIPSERIKEPLVIEGKFIMKISDGLYVGGSIDRIDNDCIVDFKTVEKKPNELVIPLGYKLQLLTYAMIARANGFEINRIRIVYGVRPQKTIAARCFVVTEGIIPESEELWENTMTLVKDSLKAVEKYPDLAYIIFRDTSLKENI